MGSFIFLAAEDSLGAAVGRCLVAETKKLTISQTQLGNGFGQLKIKCAKYQQMAQNGLPVLMLTDLDRKPCPSAIINDWLNQTPHASFLFRVCIREVEAWLMAHPEPLAKLFRIKVHDIPTAPETLPDPKETLLRLADRAPRNIRNGIQPSKGSTALVGPEYNDLLVGLIENGWDCAKASHRAPSLAKARLRIGELANRVGRG